MPRRPCAGSIVDPSQPIPETTPEGLTKLVEFWQSLVEYLDHRYDDRIQEIILQKTQLTDELKRASALLESERGRFMTATENGNADAVSAEVARVQTMILELGKRIDDPTTDLSTVIRKNVERAELNAYLKGIQYSTGNNKGI